MKNIYFKSKIATPKFLMLLLTALLGFTFAANAQVRVPFTQRTSQFTPTKKIYSIKGDFTMMGNTNLTLQNYGDLTQNGNNTMVYVDVDSPTATGLGGTQTFNSSSATLGLSTENGAVPSCSNIIYAGLYWTGRAGNSSPNNNTFSVTKSSPAPGAALNQTQTVDHNEDIASSNYDMTVSRQGGSNARYPRYRFSNGTTEYDFIFQNDNTVSVRINGGTYGVIGSTVTTNGSNKTATLTTPYVINDGFVVITINSFTRPSSNNLSEGDYQSGSTASVHIGGNANSTLDVTKNFDKRKIQFKGPGASSYSEFTANASDIYYPTTQDDYMYSAYAEVTDYVKTHGLGEYTAADIALIEGNGGGTGYYGGWGLIVVYENSKMKYRDVTIFDGHAYVIGGTASNDLPISGFNTVQAGPVGIKLGLMAGEGDNGISGDYFQIQRQDNSTWQSLNHSANSTGNFFNSSIQTAGARTPNLVNNTGLDISMFNLPNTGNGLITNNQTSTTFRYGSTQDTYIIFAIAMAVDAYIPDVEGDLSAVSINNVPVPAVGPYTALPGQEMEFKINVRNRGTEAINNAKLTIPIPYNTEYVNNSAVRQVFFTPAPTPNTLTFNPALGSNGSVVWDIGTLPVPANPDTILGTLTFRISVTTDCELLKNANCQNIVAVNGSFTGTGAITGIAFNDRDLIQGYTTNGTCQGTAISAPLLVNVNAQDYVNTHCQSTPPITAFTFCSTGAAIPITAVSGSFPNGSTFYNQYPVGPNTTQYTISNPFPATLGTQTYYAVPPGALNGCFFQFTITVTTINTTPTVAGPVNYCQGANAVPLTATPSSPGLTLYYYLTQNGQPQMSITPATGNVGTFTYYVAEAQSPTCIGPKVPITVNVYPAPAVTAPTNATFNGCGPDVITGLTYSTSPVTITLAQFQAAGGNISNVANIGNYTITYTDVRSGNCPVIVTRTFTVTSACGNVNVTQTINIMDSTPPVIAGLPAEPTTLQCPATPTWVTPSATDNCEGLVTLTSSDTTVQGNCGGSYTITRTWTATDLCGNVATATQVFNVVDTTAPVISQLPAATTIDCPATPSWTTPTATDTCGGNVTLTSNDVTTPGSCPNSYTIVRTWTATDACGNTATASQTINVQDITAPTITTQAQNLTIQCTAGNQNALNQWLASNGGAVASDSCSAVTWSNDFTTIGTDCSAAVTVIFTATDACGNTATTSATFTVSDTTAPVAPAAPANVNVACASQVPANVTLTAQDNCSGAIAVQGTDVTTPGNCPNSFTIVRTWTFTDACGNSSSVSQTINVNDTVAPVAPTAPANVTASCSAEVPANVTLTAQDNCQGAIEAQGVDVTTPGACAGSYTIVRTWTFADACGNTSSVSQTITVNDTVAPVAPAAPANVTAACASEVPANVELTAQDNCQGAITVSGVDVTTPGNCPNSFTIVRTWTFADACGNTSSVSQTITVNDNVAPVAPAAPANVTAACASEVPANVTLTAQDNCSGAITAQGVDVTTPGNCPNSFTIVRTWTFADACGNTSSVSQTITVNDNVAPVAPAAPANVTAACASEVPANVTLTAQDNCSGAITAQGIDVTTPGNCPNSFTIVRTWTFADACGNSSSVSQTITVNDNVAPVAPTAPANITAQCSAEVPANVTLTAQDNCSGAITAQGVDVTTPGACAGSFTIVRTWTFTDACGNTSSVSQTISVNDNVAPVAPAAPANVTVACASEVPANVTLTAQDNCQGAITAQGIDVTTPGACAGSFTIVRTWTFTDACGNTSSVSQTISVNDNVAPVAPAAPANVTVACASEVPANVTLTAQDNCQGAITAQGIDVTTPGQCANSFTIVRTWTFADACGNTSSVSQTITVNDNIAPTISELPAATTIDCPATPSWTTPTATDNCSGAVQLTSNDVTTPGSCPNAYTIVRTWTATDACGNVATASQTINVQDITAPVITAQAQNLTIQCGANQNALNDWLASNGGAAATDSCSAVTWTNNYNGIGNDCSAAITVIFTATDACGNASTTSATFTVSDTTAPVAPAAPANVTVQCTADVPANVSLTAVDNCAGEITVQGVDVTTPGACAGSFTIVRTWTFVDACANTSSVSQTITVNDTTAPVAPQAPANITAACASEVPANVALTAQDNCQGAITVEGVDVTTPGNCPNSFVIVRTWTFADTCGNSSSVSQTITVNDNVAPVAPAAPANVTAACASEVPANVTLTAQDNCQGAITAEGVDVTTPGNCPNSFTIVRTWTFTDACGNTSSVSQTILVNDNVAPVAPQAPANVTASCSAEVPANVTLTAQDNCSGAIEAQGVDVTTPGACAGSFTIVRTWTFTDACGNTSSVSQTISVNDTVAPVAPEAPANVTAQCAAEVPANVTLTATDNCGEVITAQGVDVTTPGNCTNSFVIVRTWTFADACGNTSSVSQTITVNDNIAPVISELPAATTIDCPATPTFAQATATDNCAGDVNLTFEDVTTQGQCAGSYSITRTWTATDACGNTATATQTINVQDITAPTITAEAQNLAIQCGAGNENALNDWLASNGGATATDACSAVTWTNNYNGIGNDCTSAVTVIFTATDACGNASTTSATFTVSDTTAPVAPEAPAAVTVQCAADVPANVTLTATDNCAGNIAVQGVDVTTPGQCAGSYTIVRTWTFVDACANSVSVSQTITVNDTTAPVAPAAPANVNVSCAGEVPSSVTLTAQDNCQGAITAEGVDVVTPGSCPNSFTVVRTWTFTDACGNSSSVSQTINVNDTVAPVAPEAPANVTAQCSGEVPANVTLTATDDCGEQIAAQGVDVMTPGQCEGSFTIVRTWTFTDACGNSSSVSQTISVNDTTAPVAPQAPANVTLACAGDVPANVSLTATDNCGGEITAEGVDVTTPGNCANSFVIVRTWTFADACGNSSSVSQTITVNDNVAPIIDELPATATIECPATPEFAQATATDNCGGDVTLTFEDATTQGTCAGSYSITRTWTATDACGNTATATQTINVQDTTAPTVTAEAQNLAIQCGTGNENALDQWLTSNGGATATDSCSTVTWTNNYNGIGNDCSTAVTVIFTATDACGNASTTSATFTISDTIAPVAPEAPANVTVACAAEVPANVSLTATDNCLGEISVQGVDVTTPGACAGTYTIVRTWTFTDACANTTSISQTINVIDNVAPTAPEAPANATVQCGDALPENVTLTATDNCGEQISAQGVDVQTAGECAGTYTIVRTWTFADACGNTSSVSQTINVIDTVAPVAPEAPADVTVQCAGEVPGPISLTANDACSGPIAAVKPVDEITPGSCPNSFTLVRTWTFTDACGNTSSVSQTITVNDTTAPVAPEAPADVTASCGGEVPANVTLTATDNCGDTISVEGVDVTTKGNCANSYTIVRTWTFTDACGNSSSVSQNISVGDTTAPVLPENVPANVTVSCASEVPAAVTLTATDNCSETPITVEAVDSVAPGNCANSFVITRTWTFADACGNTSVATQVITVNDTTAPTFNEPTPADVTLSCDEIPAAATLTAVDNCGNVAVAVTMTETTTQGTCAGSYTLTRTWSATDACGNVATVSQDINVIDNDAPTFVETTPAPAITAECGQVPAPAVLTAVDGCNAAPNAVVYAESSVPGQCPVTEIITRTWTATDACGNVQSFTQIVTVQDTTAPTVNETLEPVVNVTCDQVPAVPTLTFSDACSTVGTPVFTEVITEPVGGNYSITWTWVVADACNNTATFTQVVNVTISNSEVTVNRDECNQDSSLSIDLTTLLPAGTPAGGTFVNVDGVLGLNGNTLTPFQTPNGTYTIDYVVDDVTCPRVVHIEMNLNETFCEVDPACTVTVNNAFSPNNDGINEVFNISGFENTECVVSNNVEIYNRWGILVFEMKNYNNNDRAFRGVSEGRVTLKKDDELPTGTYFYIISYKKADGTSGKLDGYLYLSR